MKEEDTVQPESRNGGAAIQIVNEAVAETLWELGRAADESGLTRDDVMRYCEAGLMQTFVVEKRETLYLDENGLYRLKQIRYLMEVEGVNPEGVHIIVQLLRRLQHADRELRFLRDR